MALKKPESMDECVYFTKRAIDDGSVTAWVFRGDCPECGKAKMGKPRDEKTGKVKIRAKEYLCPECGYTVEKEEYEGTLTACIEYVCPHCKYKGEIEVPFKRKKVRIFDVETQKKVSADAIVFECGKCKEKINVTKKMKK